MLKLPFDPFTLTFLDEKKENSNKNKEQRFSDFLKDKDYQIEVNHIKELNKISQKKTVQKMIIIR